MSDIEHKKVSKAQQRAVSKYMKEHYEEIKVRVPKGAKAIIQAYASEAGESVNEYIKKAVAMRSQDDRIAL